MIPITFTWGYGHQDVRHEFPAVPRKDELVTLPHSSASFVVRRVMWEHSASGETEIVVVLGG